MDRTTLSTLGHGDHCFVADIASEHTELKSKLYALGIIPGSKIEILRFAPLGDPMQVKVGNSLISIRKSEAEVIEVELN